MAIPEAILEALPAGVTPHDLVTVLIIITNMLSSTTLITINKQILTTLKFPYVITLTCMHFIINFGIQVGLLKLKVYEYKKVSVRDTLELAISFSGSIVFLNLSLQYNTVGFYQVTKLLTIPAMVAVNFIWYAQRNSLRVNGALLVMLLGVGIALVTDVGATFLGFIFSVLGVICTTLYQIWNGYKQKTLNISTMHVLLHQAPVAALLLAVIAPMVEDWTSKDGLLATQWDVELVTYLSLSCIAAFFVNVTSYLLIGRTSAVTYQVCGHLKTCIIFMSGWFYLGDPFVPRNVMGICIAVVAIVVYSYYKLQDQKAAEEAVDPESQGTRLEAIELDEEEELGLLSDPEDDVPV